MPNHIKGQSRTQVTLFPEALDDFVTEDNPVRVIDVFVDELNLKQMGFNRVIAKRTGRPGYHPATILKLYIYGYLNRIQSSRRLETEANRNIELMWLLERLKPDFKTIADFRRDNAQGIKQACSHFVTICREMGMFSEGKVAIDGSKFKAVNSKPNNFTPQKAKDHIDRVEASIEKYLKQLDEVDIKEVPEKKVQVMKDKLAWLKKRLGELQEIKKIVEAHPDKQISLTDPDARLLKTRNMERQVCYNIQSAVDTKYHLIVYHDVTNRNDRGELARVTKLTQQALNRTDITVLADKGYYSRTDVKATLDLGANPLVPKTDTSGNSKKGLFTRSQFKYDSERDLYVCPANQELPKSRRGWDDGLEQDFYYSQITCRDCEVRDKCTTSKKEPRKMRRWVHEAEVEAMLERLDDSPDTPVIRKQTVEHPFGTIKMWMGATHFLTRQFKNVSTEMNLHVLAYNMKRMISIMGVQSLNKAIREL
ncbi:TPA: IS1182 family transposase [Vibrio parahaemolyticus]|nr:IS1182 family transposase [Vibrio parahaemolyticus]